jgi:hypothetical protein
MDGNVACDQGINGPYTSTVGGDCVLSSGPIGDDNSGTAQKFSINRIADLTLHSVGDRLARRRQLTL